MKGASYYNAISGKTGYSVLNEDTALSSDNSCHGKIPVEHLDYKYIEKCTDVKYMEKILTLLRSGVEGDFPDLVRYCEDHLQRLDPKSQSLRKDNPVARLSSVPEDEWSEIVIDPKYWEEKDKQRETQLKQQSVFPENMPPIRSNFSIPLSQNPQIANSSKKAFPREYREWDKYDVEKECEKIDADVTMEDSSAFISSDKPKIESTVDATSRTLQEKLILAEHEKDKGNDAFKAGDYKEAVIYYSRSISVTPTVVAYSNKAQAQIQLKDWHNAMNDCQKALELEPGNTKALLRRAEVQKNLRNFHMAAEDLRSLLREHPQHRQATKLLAEVDKKIREGQSQHQNKGKKILLQEDDDDDFVEDTFASLKQEGNNFVKKGQYLDAVVKYSQCLEMNPKDPVVYLNRAHCYLKLERFAEAKQDCDASLKLDITYKAFYKRAMAHKGLQDYPACSSDLQVVLLHNPNFQEAERELEKVVVLHLTNNSVSPAKRRRIVPITEVEGDEEMEEVSGDWENHHGEEEVNIDLHPTNEFVQSLNMEKDCQNIFGDVTMEEDPPAVLDSGHPRNQSEVDVKAWVTEQMLDSANREKDRGNKAYRGGLYEQAVADYSRSIAIAPTVVAFNNRAQAQIKLKQWGNAMIDCQAVLEQEPGNLKALLRRAEVYKNFGNFQMAVDDLRLVLGEVPHNLAATKLLTEVETLQDVCDTPSYIS